MPDDFAGLGSPVFVYYAPAFYYATALINSFVNDVWTAMNIVSVLTTAVYGMSVFVLLRSTLGNGLAVLGAVTAQASPFYYAILNHINFLPWHASFVFAALCLLFIVRGNGSSLLVDWRLAVASAALVLTHILAAFILIICVASSAIVLTLASRGSGVWSLARLVRLGASIAAGLAIAMIYLLPAVGTLAFVGDASLVSANMHWYTTFAFPLYSAATYGTWWNLFQWVIPAALLLPAGLVGIYVFSRADAGTGLLHSARFLMIVSAAAFFFASELSYPLWRYAPFIDKVQFPFRFLYLAAIAVPIAAALAVRHRAQTQSLLRWSVALIVPLGATVALTAWVAVDLVRNGFSHRDAPIDPTWGVWAPQDRGEQWLSYVTASGLPGECEAKGLTCADVSQSPQQREWQFDAPVGTSVRLPVFSYPAWVLAVNGEPVERRHDPETGLLVVALSPGRNDVALTWSSLPQERAGAWATSLAIILLLSAALFRRAQLRRRA